MLSKKKSFSTLKTEESNYTSNNERTNAAFLLYLAYLKEKNHSQAIHKNA